MATSPSLVVAIWSSFKVSNAEKSRSGFDLMKEQGSWRGKEGVIAASMRKKTKKKGLESSDSR